MSLLTKVTLPNGALFNTSQTFLGAGSLFTTGTVYFVSSVTGANGNNGTDPSSPKATLAGAMAAVTASKGDFIVIMPNHTETIGDESIAIDKTGVTIVGLGKGGDMPQFLMNHANAEFSVSANDVTIENIRLTADVTDVLIGIEIEADVNDTTIRGCLFDTVAEATDEFAKSVNMVDGNIRTTIEGCRFHQGLGGAVSA